MVRAALFFPHYVFDIPVWNLKEAASSLVSCLVGHSLFLGKILHIAYIFKI